MLHFSFQNSEGILIYRTGYALVTGWWCSLPGSSAELVRAAMGAGFPEKHSPLIAVRQGRDSMPYIALTHHSTGDQKNPPLWESSRSSFYQGNISKAIVMKKEPFFINSNNSNSSSSNNGLHLSFSALKSF